MLGIILGINFGAVATCTVIVTKMLRNHKREMNQYKEGYCNFFKA